MKGMDGTEQIIRAVNPVPDDGIFTVLYGPSQEGVGYFLAVTHINGNIYFLDTVTFCPEMTARVVAMYIERNGFGTFKEWHEAQE